MRCRASPASSGRSSTSSSSTSSTTRSSTGPQPRSPTRLRSDVETPLVEGALVEIGRAGQEAGAGVARAQSGLLRTYALAITATVVVLAIVFVSVR